MKALIFVLLVMVTAGLGSQIPCDAFAKVWGQPRIRSVNTDHDFRCFFQENYFSAFRSDTNVVMMILPDAKISCFNFDDLFYCEMLEPDGAVYSNTLPKDYFVHLLYLNSL